LNNLGLLILELQEKIDPTANGYDANLDYNADEEDPMTKGLQDEQEDAAAMVNCCGNRCFDCDYLFKLCSPLYFV